MFARVCVSDLVGEACGFFDVRGGGFEPEEIGIGSEFNSSFDCCWQPCTVVVQTFSGPWDVP